MKRIAVYPGSFDPVTNGHLDIIRRATRLFDQVIVAVTDSSDKQPSYSIDERLALLREAARRMPRVRVEFFQGLLVNYARQKKACAIIRGLRAVSDFEYEFQMALMNRRLASGVETVFLMPDEKYTYLSSRMLKEILRLGGSIRGLVPASIEKSLQRGQKTA